MLSLQFSTTFVQLHSCHLFMSLHVWYDHIKSMTKELESKMCNFISFLSSCENWVTEFSKILIQLNSSHQYDHFEVQHAYVSIKIKEVMSNQKYLSPVACSHYSLVQFVFSYIHVICTCLFMCVMSI